MTHTRFNTLEGEFIALGEKSLENMWLLLEVAGGLVLVRSVTKTALEYLVEFTTARGENTAVSI